MPILRLLIAAVVAVAAMIAGLFAAILVALTALVGLVSLRFSKRNYRQRPTASRRPAAARDGAIDVEAEEVSPPVHHLPRN